MRKYVFFLVLLVVVLNSVAQLCFKATAISSRDQTVLGLFNLWLLLAALLLGFSFLCWQSALRYKPLSFLHPFCALVYALVPVLCVLFFQEQVCLSYGLGMVCIMAGVCLTSLGVRPPQKNQPC